MRLTYEDAAREEALDAATWYGQRHPELGIRFLEKWKEAENRIVANPLIHRCFEGTLRRCRFDVFPYAIVFRIVGEELQVVAVMHMSRRPGYWKDRE